MPLYEFECKECKNEEALLLSVAERDEPRKCKKCEGEQERKVSRTGKPVIY